MKQQLQYILIPHPDDEFSAWSLIQNSTAHRRRPQQQRRLARRTAEAGR